MAIDLKFDVSTDDHKFEIVTDDADGEMARIEEIFDEVGIDHDDPARKAVAEAKPDDDGQFVISVPREEVAELVEMLSYDWMHLDERMDEVNSEILRQSVSTSQDL